MTLQVLEWSALDAAQRARALARPAAGERQGVADAVRKIVTAVRQRGDAALREFAERFDGGAPASLRVPASEVDAAAERIGSVARSALERAAANVRRFHEAQRLAPLSIETSPGVRCERIVRPIGAVGLYVPAGSAPLPSALIMSAVPAALAGCPRRVLCSPPGRDGRIDPAILAAARVCDVEEIYAVGGAQAIAALAYGTESIPRVDKIFGPGSAWVTAAKQLVAADPAGAALDLPAGPSEVLVIADDTARPDFVAADLLAQAEHDPLSQAILLTPSRSLALRVAQEVGRQASALSRAQVLAASMAQSRAIVVSDVAEAVAISNDYAPEHLILEVAGAREWLDAVTSAGSVFLGHWTPEPMGDYCSGTNHVLPTYGYARAYSGLSLLDFVRRITVQEITPAGLRDLGPTAETLAGLEGLDAHAAAVRLRLDALAEGAVS
jgi:histidinol dehydrogenase